MMMPGQIKWWQGWTTGELNNRNITSKEIERAVAGIFRKSDPPEIKYL
jgi:hypothetical protein